jgi:hypothetical protein
MCFAIGRKCAGFGGGFEQRAGLCFGDGQVFFRRQVARANRKSPTRIEALLPQIVLAAGLPRRIVLSSTTSSWSSVAVWMNSTAAASACVEAFALPTALAAISVISGRSRLPPAETM